MNASRRLRLRRLLASACLAALGSSAMLSAVAFSVTKYGQGEAAAAPTPAPSDGATAPHLAMPYGDECLGCHMGPDGSIGDARVALVAHPKDWGTCTECHADDRLVPVAPGHDGIKADTCTSCHIADSGPAPPRAHEGAPDMICLDCHGKSSPLPEAMLTRSGANCWICHHSPNAR